MVKKALLIRLSAMGDVLQGLDALEALAVPRERAEVAWAASAGLLPLLEGSPALCSAIPVPGRWTAGNWLAFRRDNRGRRFDACVDLQSLLKSRLAAWALDCGEVCSFGRGLSRDLLVPFLPGRTLASRAGNSRAAYAALIRLGLGLAEAGPPVFAAPPPAPARSVSEVLCAPGAGWPTKRLDAGAWLALLPALRSAFPAARIRVLAGITPGERALAESVVAGGTASRPELAAAADLRGLGALLRAAQFFVGMDSGPAHWAARLGVRTLVFYGPSEPAWYERSHAPHRAPRGTCHLGERFPDRCPRLRRCRVCSAMAGTDPRRAWEAFAAAEFT